MKSKFILATKLALALSVLHAGAAAAQTAWVDFKADDNATTVPVRLNNGNVECASFDGQNCSWGSSAQEIANLPSLQPLACGDTHKALYGATGYDTKQHWCSSAYGRFYAKWIQSNDVLFSVNPSGDVQCFSTDGANCAWGVNDPGSDAAKAAPLACGAMHELEWGSDGYSSSGHWCAGLQQLAIDQAQQKSQVPEYSLTTYYRKGDIVQSIGRKFKFCYLLERGGGAPSAAGTTCAAGNAWEDIGWAPGAPANIQLWVTGHGWQSGDVVRYNNRVWAASSAISPNSVSSRTVPGEKYSSDNPRDLPASDWNLVGTY